MMIKTTVHVLKTEQGADQENFSHRMARAVLSVKTRVYLVLYIRVPQKCGSTPQP
jgi:hypothetical protein